MKLHCTLLLAFAAVLLCATAAHSFMFQLPSGTERCFTQEIPSNTEAKITYSSEEAYGDFLDVTITNADGAKVYAQEGKDDGVFAEHIANGGEYVICLTSRQSTKSAKSVRNILLSVKIGADAKDYDKLATKDKLRPMEVQMRVMEDTVAEVHNEFIYLKNREAEMRSTNEHMTAMVMWMSIGLILLFAAFSYLQMRHLKRYFKKKRMID
ncbi:putative mitochondrial COP-coated vesicle membrane protein gp25L precursor [Leptomonas pyrrhocoris]|uniref:Putative mitochondrial COP-coated vesicle membrane protein gp25L n=1 Tax=Leptomonas pyrrhocoris TaxID=157538 RepID=A0A0M9GAC8_LEPPY|nr:putative mitochondrial COP-coated vesicle membrane protein gp25L precursor [Leptomonas pyrrhocoris]XP_015664546.1 putative mitochondrial COP-coated vesicle membrane protein gp25L precursor [Leptomonas pyrrhocoris]XP_015664547.1 putative mitochondrial COP-coated vesicle membrane protein gp25L precursor [Leptomonas pyrrhocoris]KPA86106.1 putative mitochondrial COP-coated vesicle membrane protein gp25L precursor [Leptomonas pyrrhocoris]KPA86107.1 putative mitochondrial COP-coated vesicle membra|eukprot:XP_015664545.1 putative mitochondrial COP-coated vesicle membrane protein gp25L precursor [Leptomonas pyrrhocoris]